jgi:hypothetical protein
MHRTTSGRSKRIHLRRHGSTEEGTADPGTRLTRLTSDRDRVRPRPHRAVRAPDREGPPVAGRRVHRPSEAARTSAHQVKCSSRAREPDCGPERRDSRVRHRRASPGPYGLLAPAWVSRARSRRDRARVRPRDKQTRPGNTSGDECHHIPVTGDDPRTGVPAAERLRAHASESARSKGAVRPVRADGRTKPPRSAPIACVGTAERANCSSCGTVLVKAPGVTGRLRHLAVHVFA